MKYSVDVPATREQGTFVTVCEGGYFETYRQNALSDYNSARAHDGLPPVKRMPKGTTYKPFYLK
jgi:hypothetical protein